MTESNRFAAISWLRAKYDNDSEHSDQVADLALQLFDQLGDLHQLGKQERALLQAAALLHDIGQHMGLKGHHKSSKKLIMQNKLDGWTKKEKCIIALVARYHRKAPPSPSHNAFRELDEQNQMIVKKLAALLRIADGLDRCPQSAIDNIVCNFDHKEIRLLLICKTDIDLEIIGFHKKRDYFTKVYQRDIIIDNIASKEASS